MLDRLAGLMGRAGMSAMAIPFSLLLALLIWLLFSTRKRKSSRGERNETH